MCDLCVYVYVGGVKRFHANDRKVSISLSKVFFILDVNNSFLDESSWFVYLLRNLAPELF